MNDENIEKDTGTDRPPPTHAERQRPASAAKTPTTGRQPQKQAPSPATESAGVRYAQTLSSPTVGVRVDHVRFEAARECVPLPPRDVPMPESLHDVERVAAVAALASLYQLGYVMRVFPALDGALAQFRSGELRVTECPDELALHEFGRQGYIVSRPHCATLVARTLGTQDPELPAGAYVDRVAPRLWSQLVAELGHDGPRHWNRALVIAETLSAHWTQALSDDAVMTIRDLHLQFDAATQILADLSATDDYWISVRRFAGDDGLLAQWRTHDATQRIFSFVVSAAAGEYAGTPLLEQGPPATLGIAAATLSSNLPPYCPESDKRLTDA